MYVGLFGYTRKVFIGNNISIFSSSWASAAAETKLHHFTKHEICAIKSTVGIYIIYSSSCHCKSEWFSSLNTNKDERKKCFGKKTSKKWLCCNILTTLSTVFNHIKLKKYPSWCAKFLCAWMAMRFERHSREEDFQWITT